KPFPALAESIPRIPAAKPRFEPKKKNSINPQTTTLGGGLRAKLGELDDVRTYGGEGLRLVHLLNAWLATTPRAELLSLHSKLRALFRSAGTQKAARLISPDRSDA